MTNLNFDIRISPIRSLNKVYELFYFIYQILTALYFGIVILMTNLVCDVQPSC